MTVKELINTLKQVDENKVVWLMMNWEPLYVTSCYVDDEGKLTITCDDPDIYEGDDEEAY